MKQGGGKITVKRDKNCDSQTSVEMKLVDLEQRERKIQVKIN